MEKLLMQREKIPKREKTILMLKAMKQEHGLYMDMPKVI
jgi:hypothetical protein